MISKQLRELSTVQLIYETARDLNGGDVWAEFSSRFKHRIVKYCWHAFRLHGEGGARFHDLIDDFTQDFYKRLLQNDGRAIRSFRGQTEDSVYAFLAAVAKTTVQDYLRHQNAERRSAKLISLEDLKNFGRNAPSSNAFLADLIDAERVLEAEGYDNRNRERDRLIFKLHFVEGLTASELAAVPAFQLTVSGIEKVLGRLRSRLQRLRTAPTKAGGRTRNFG
jgi:RNA polymerase sigma factor (sigma-70 family)